MAGARERAARRTGLGEREAHHVCAGLLAHNEYKADISRHGRDNKLIVWSFKISDESSYSTVLPLDGSAEPRLKPWILTILDVNSMNFCSFASCPAPSDPDASDSASALLIAVPNALDLEAVSPAFPVSDHAY